MKPTITESEPLKKAFRRVHLSRRGPDPDRHFQTRVMASVREIGPLGSGPGFWSSFESVLWRLAPVNAVLMASLIALLVVMDFDSRYDYLGTLTSESESAALSDFTILEG